MGIHVNHVSPVPFFYKQVKPRTFCPRYAPDWSCVYQRVSLFWTLKTLEDPCVHAHGRHKNFCTRDEIYSWSRLGYSLDMNANPEYCLPPCPQLQAKMIQDKATPQMGLDRASKKAVCRPVHLRPLGLYCSYVMNGSTATMNRDSAHSSIRGSYTIGSQR